MQVGEVYVIAVEAALGLGVWPVVGQRTALPVHGCHAVVPIAKQQARVVDAQTVEVGLHGHAVAGQMQRKLGVAGTDLPQVYLPVGLALGGVGGHAVAQGHVDKRVVDLRPVHGDVLATQVYAAAHYVEAPHPATDGYRGYQVLGVHLAVVEFQ